MRRPTNLSAILLSRLHNQKLTHKSSPIMYRCVLFCSGHIIMYVRSPLSFLSTYLPACMDMVSVQHNSLCVHDDIQRKPETISPEQCPELVVVGELK